MKTINLKKIIEDLDLDVKEVSIQLFPSNKYPKLALDRVLSGKAFLDSNQISKLSMLTNIPIQELYAGGKWTKQSTSGQIKFTSGDYEAVLNTIDWTTKIFHKGSLFHESLLHEAGIPLSDYLITINSLIINHITNESN